MTHRSTQAAAGCFVALAITMGATQAFETWESGPAGAGSGVLETPEEPLGGKATGLSCGEETDPFDIPVENHTTVANAHDDASFAVAALELYAEVGLGRPSCDDSNCGFGQTCPSAGGSQTISGGVSAGWRAPFSLSVDLDIEPGTQGIQTCANCS